MPFLARPIAFKPPRLNGLSAKLIASHYENNYGAAVRRLNRAAIDNVVYAPLGFYLRHQAWHKNVAGVVQGPLPFCWGVSKTA